LSSIYVTNAKYYTKENIMRDTTKELNDSLDKLKHYTRTPVLMNGVLAVLVVCIPLLTLSTILWQWLG